MVTPKCYWTIALVDGNWIKFALRSSEIYAQCFLAACTGETRADGGRTTFNGREIVRYGGSVEVRGTVNFPTHSVAWKKSAARGDLIIRRHVRMILCKRRATLVTVWFFVLLHRHERCEQ